METSLDRGWVFAFPGLQPFESGQARELARSHPEIVRIVRACDAVVRTQSSRSILPFWFGKQFIDPVIDCRLCYPLVLSHQIVLLHCLARLGLEPAAVVGLSAGEPGAAYAAGMIGLEDALRIAIQTGVALEKYQGWQRIVSIHAAASHIEPLINEDRNALEIALVISEQLTVVSGGAGAIERLIARAEALSFRSTQVPFTFGAHNSRMNAMRRPLLEALRCISPREASLPYMSATTGEWLSEARQVGPEYWWLHASAKIRFREALDKLWAAGYRRFIEVGVRSLFSAELRQYGAEVLAASEITSGRRAESALRA